MRRIINTFKDKFEEFKKHLKEFKKDDIEDLKLPVRIVQNLHVDMSDHKLKNEDREDLRVWMNENKVTYFDKKTVHVVNKILDDKDRQLDKNSSMLLKEAMTFNKYAQSTRMPPRLFLDKASEMQYKIAGSFAYQGKEIGGSVLHLILGITMKLMQGVLEYETRKLGK